MHITHLSFANVRSFRRLDADLSPGLHVVTGPNGSGKSNLLEAIALLATTRSLRTSSDVDLVSWDALREEPLPAARLVAHVHTAADDVQLEVVVSARPGASDDQPAASRRFRVNGVARRASDLIGRLRVVLFSADDLAIVEGAPALRRRYLDITLSQLAPAYVRALQRYQRVLQQRNSLLRRLQERRGRTDELDFWDEELAQTGALLHTHRAQALVALNRGASERYAALASGTAALEVCYRPALPPALSEILTARKAEVGDVSVQPEPVERSASPEPVEGGPGPRGNLSDLGAQLLTLLVESRPRDVQAGTTRYGPHRDDVAFLIAGHPAASSASRGELRGIALALRLAEVALSTDQTGDPPVLLLDDVLSELDSDRRARVLAAAFEVDQVVITSPDPDRPSRTELPSARRYTIAEGALSGSTE